jgi:hypothetical protein
MVHYNTSLILTKLFIFYLLFVDPFIYTQKLIGMTCRLAELQLLCFD